jgi:hypothetical protein
MTLTPLEQRLLGTLTAFEALMQQHRGYPPFTVLHRLRIRIGQDMLVANRTAVERRQKEEA